MKKIAIIGSSGGNLYNLGGKDPKTLLGEIKTQCQSAGIEIAKTVFIGASQSMDKNQSSANASLFSYEGGEFVGSAEMSLSDLNEIAKEKDALLAAAIKAGEVDGMIIMSCDPSGVNKASIEAAAEKKIPLVGTGGTSVATTQSMGGRVISASGTTGTTNRTRAVAFLTSLSKEFGVKYSPIIGGKTSAGADDGKSVFGRINFRGIMMAAMPAFISMALMLAIGKIPGLTVFGDIFGLINGALPIVIAAIAAKQVSGLDEVGIVSGIIAGVLSTTGGVIGGIVGGILAGIISYYLITACFKMNFPATTANIIAGGLGGVIAGLLVYFFISPLALMLGNGVRAGIEAALAFSPIAAGLLAGALIWPAIIGGVYHAAILPIVLLEMEQVGHSFLGAVDMTGLVMVSAGITLANVLFPKVKSEAAVALPGFLINMGFGTFVEAAYPFMFSDKKVFAGAIVASSVSGALVGLFNLRGTAYLPSVVAPTLSTNPLAFIACMAVAMGLAFIFTVMANKMSVKKGV